MKQAALVLSGGSALGLAHIGVVEKLQEAGYTFDAIYGVSAGAIIGACLAGGIRPQEIEQAFFDTDLKKLGWDFSRAPSGLIRGKRIHTFLNNFFDDRDIEDLDVPFSAGTVDFVTGEYVELTQGNIADALRASFSLPMIFETREHPGTMRVLVDGGLVQNLPLREAVRDYQGDTIIAINVHPLFDYIDPLPKRSRFGLTKNITKYLMHSFNIMINSQHPDISDERVHIITPDLKAFAAGSLKADTHREIIRAGHQAGKKFIEKTPR